MYGPPHLIQFLVESFALYQKWIVLHEVYKEEEEERNQKKRENLKKVLSNIEGDYDLFLRHI